MIILFMLLSGMEIPVFREVLSSRELSGWVGYGEIDKGREVDFKDAQGCSLVGGWFRGLSWSISMPNDTLLYMGDGPYLVLLNVKDYRHPREVWRLRLPAGPFYWEIIGGIRGMCATDSFVYVGCSSDTTGNRLCIVDVYDIKHPKLVGICDFRAQGIPEDVDVRGGYAYVACSYGTPGLVVIDVSDAYFPRVVATLDVGGSRDLQVVDTLVFVACGRGVSIVNITDPLNPYEALLYTGSAVSGLCVRDTMLYAACGFNRFQMLDISDLFNPVFRGWCETEYFYTFAVDVAGDYACVLSGGTSGGTGVNIIDVSQPPPVVCGWCDTFGGTHVEICATDSVAYTVDEDCGVLVVDYSDPYSPQEAGWHDRGFEAQDVWVIDSVVYMVDGPDAYSALWVLNAARPESCSLFTWYFLLPLSTDARDIWISGDYIYIADYGDLSIGYNGGFFVFRIVSPDSIELIGHYFVPASVNRFFLSDSLLYLAALDSGVYVYDVSDVYSPSFVERYYTSGIAKDVYVKDTLLFIAEGDSGVFILDVSDVFHPVEVSRYKLLCGHLIARDSLLYCGSATNFFILDISDPFSPVLLGIDSIHSCRDMEIVGSLVYIANPYGLQVEDVSDPCHPRCVASYRSEDCGCGLSVGDDGLVYLADGLDGLYILRLYGQGVSGSGVFSGSEVGSCLRLSYRVTGFEHVKFSVYDVMGRCVSVLFDGFQGPGDYSLRWDGEPGIYFVHGRIGEREIKKKVLIVK